MEFRRSGTVKVMTRQNGDQPARRLTVAELLAQHGKSEGGSGGGSGRRHRRRAPEEDVESELTTTAPQEIIDRIHAEQPGVDWESRESNGHSVTGNLDTETRAVRPPPLPDVLPDVPAPQPPKASRRRRPPEPPPTQQDLPPVPPPVPPEAATTRTDIKPAGRPEPPSRPEMNPVARGERTGFAPPVGPPGTGYNPAVQPPADRTPSGYNPAVGPNQGSGYHPVVNPGQGSGYNPAVRPPRWGETDGPDSIADRLNGTRQSLTPLPQKPGQPPKPTIKPAPGGQAPVPPPPRRPLPPQPPVEITDQFDAVADDYDLDGDLVEDDYTYDDELDYLEDEELVEEPELLSGRTAVDEDAEAEDEEPEEELSPGRQWLAVGGQLALGVVGGAAVWLLFNWLWGELPVVALLTALAVTAGLVWIVRNIRKQEDLQSTVLAVLVGLVVTVSPAMLLLLSR